MSNHFSGPDFAFPNGDARLDISDLYVFPTPGDSTRTVLMMNLHPSISFNPPGLTADDGFAPHAVYEFRIDNDGDAVANTVYQIRFSPLRDGRQTASVTRSGVVATASEPIMTDALVSASAEVRITEAGEHRFYAGPRSDPFYADVAGAMNNLQFSGSDSMVDMDIYAIVLEIPNKTLDGDSRVGIWATVRIPAVDGKGWIQVDRAGRPETVNFYCQGEDKAAFNAGEPAEDRSLFLAKFAHALEHMGQYPPDEAIAVAETLLPDLLPYDYRLPPGLPENGRTLTDDAFDLALSVYTRRPITDGVGPHADLLADFPYLGPPHKVRSAPQTAASTVGA
jgi:hypothetical protein